MTNESQFKRVTGRLLRRNSWADKCKLEYFFGISSDNDPRDGENSGEPPQGETFI